MINEEEFKDKVFEMNVYVQERKNPTTAVHPGYDIRLQGILGEKCGTNETIILERRVNQKNSLVVLVDTSNHQMHDNNRKIGENSVGVHSM